MDSIEKIHKLRIFVKFRKTPNIVVGQFQDYRYPFHITDPTFAAIY